MCRVLQLGCGWLVAVLGGRAGVGVAVSVVLLMRGLTLGRNKWPLPRERVLGDLDRGLCWPEAGLGLVTVGSIAEVRRLFQDGS